MPFIDLKTTKKISADCEKELTRDFGEKIALIPGKSEKWLMLNFEGECRMAFAGNANDDMAMLEVKLFGGASGAAYDALTAALTDSVSDILGVGKERIYVKYEESSHWGWNGSNF